MEHLAACHLMSGFLRVPHSGAPRRGQHASAPSCQHVKRFLSLADRRGLISPARGNARGFISAPATFAHAGAARAGAAKMDDEWEGMARRIHHAGHPLGHMQSWATQMPFIDANCVLRTFEFGAERHYCAGNRRRGRSEAASVRVSAEGGQQEQPGRLLVRLQYSHRRLSVHVLRICGLHDASAPSLLVWLLRAGQGTLEKRDTAHISLRDGMAWIPTGQWAFDARPDDLDDTAVVIMVMDSFAEVGHCILGQLSGADATGAQHWREATDRTGKSVTQWHRLSAEW